MKQIIFVILGSIGLSRPAKCDTLIRVMHDNLDCPLVTDRSVLVLVSKT